MDKSIVSPFFDSRCTCVLMAAGGSISRHRRPLDAVQHSSGELGELNSCNGCATRAP